MASITVEKRAKKMVIIAIATLYASKNGEIIHRESKTFSKKELARNCGKVTSNRLEENEALLNLYFNDHVRCVVLAALL